MAEAAPVDDWERAPPAPAGGVDDWERVPATPAPEPTLGTQGITDRLSRGFMATSNPLAIYAGSKLKDIAADTATFFHEGVEQAVGAVTGNGPSQLEDLRPEVEKQLISVGRTPEIAKLETEQLMRSWRRQERMGGAVMGPLTALTAPVLGAYRSLISRPLEEVGGPPKEVTETFGMVAGAVAGLPAMSREMARVSVTPDGKVSAQRVGDLPKGEDFRTAADLLTRPEEPAAPSNVQRRLGPGVFEEGDKAVIEGAPRADYVEKIGSGDAPLPTTQELSAAIEATKGADLQYSKAIGLTEQEFNRVRTLNRMIDNGSDAAIKEKNAILDKVDARHELDIPDEGSLRQLRTEFENLERSATETPAEHEDGIARVLKRYIGKVIDDDPFARAVFRKALDESNKAGFDTKRLTNDVINRYLSDLSPSDQAFARQEFERFLRPKIAPDPAIVEQNLRTLWDERGIHPAEALNEAKGDAWLKHELTQPAPPEPEKIQTAAIRVEGKTFTGYGHGDAIVAAEDALGIEPNTLLDKRNVENGFLTTTGRFVDRHEADRIARGPEADAGGLDSWDLPALHDQIGAERVPHPDRPLGAALQAVDELRDANRDLPDADRAILGELISAVRGAAAKRQLSVDYPEKTGPNVVQAFHGTSNELKGNFGEYSFFTDKKSVAEYFAEVNDTDAIFGGEAKGKVHDVKIDTTGFTEYDWPKFSKSHGGAGTKKIDAAIMDELVDELSQSGAPGAIIRNVVEPGATKAQREPHTQYIVADWATQKPKGVVQQGDRFKKAPLSDTAPAADAIAEHAWVEADQDLARAQAALARIEEVKARHPELAGQIDAAAQAVEDTLAQRDAMRPKSLGAAASDPPLVPLTEQPPPPAGSLVASAQEGVRTLFDIGRDIQMKVAPMATGTRDAILTAKDFANTMRKNRWEWARIHDYISKTFSPEQWKRMWDAADEESVLRQEGKTSEHMGLATLTPEERAIVEGLHARAENAWLRARDIGLVEGEGLPAYTPRMVINAAGAIAEQGSLPLNSIGTNLKASTARLMKRKYLTAEETEAAAKGKYGDQAELVRDIRTLPLATAQLEDAIAGRTLVNEIKKAGKAGGTDAAVEGFNPSNPEQKWFTIDHPALKTWRPKFEEVDGKVQVVKDKDGNTIFEQVPIYIRGDFEGPLRAVLDVKSGALYQATMELKGKTMSMVMYSPAIHNLVELGRAFPAMPMRIFKAYFEGNAAKQGYEFKGVARYVMDWAKGERVLVDRGSEVMLEAIDSGLVPIGRRFFKQDLDAVMASPDLTPGRSWTAKLTSAVLTSERLLPQTDWMRAASEADSIAIKRGIDKLGDFWHNTLLWDRIGDLQMGLYTNLRGDLIAKGVDQKTASITAAHWANRYAGALPQEAMSANARKVSNFFLFSRSFTMGNLGVMKDILTGLPKDALAMIEREGGFKEGSIGSASDIPQVGDFTRGMAMRKAMMIVGLDIALMYGVNSIVQSVFNVMLGDKTIGEEAHGYTRRFKEILNKVEMHPAELFHPFSIAESLSSTGENEPGRRDRIKIGYQSDGTAIYARNPVGKIGEEFLGWMNSPLEMLKKKEGTVARPMLQVFQNDKGFGRVIYDKNDETYAGKAAAIWAMVEHIMKAQTPESSINAVSDLVKGEGDPKTSALQAGMPFVGVTISRGAPGGPASGELYDFRQRHETAVNMALPDIRKQILRGDLGGAMQKMRELNIPPGLQRFYIRTTLDPSTRVGGRTLRDFYMGATPEQRDRLERARQ